MEETANIMVLISVALIVCAVIVTVNVVNAAKHIKHIYFIEKDAHKRQFPESKLFKTNEKGN